MFDALLEAARARRSPRPTRWSPSGTSTRRPRSTRLRARSAPIRSARCCPRYDLVLTYGGGEPVVERLPRPRRAAVRADLQRARSRRPTIPCRADAALRLRSRASSATACPTARRGSRSSSSRAAARLPEQRFLLGGSGWDDKPLPANVRRLGHVSTARPQRVQLHRALRAQHQPREHGALRLLAGDARVRGGGRRRLPDHRRLGGHRDVPRARARGAGRRRRRRGRRASARARRGRGAPDRRRGAAARARRAHLRASGRSRSRTRSALRRGRSALARRAEVA